MPAYGLFRDIMINCLVRNQGMENPPMRGGVSDELFRYKNSYRVISALSEQ